MLSYSRTATTSKTSSTAPALQVPLQESSSTQTQQRLPMPMLRTALVRGRSETPLPQMTWFSQWPSAEGLPLLPLVHPQCLLQQAPTAVLGTAVLESSAWMLMASSRRKNGLTPSTTSSSFTRSVSESLVGLVPFSLQYGIVACCYLSDFCNYRSTAVRPAVRFASKRTCCNALLLYASAVVAEATLFIPTVFKTLYHLPCA